MGQALRGPRLGQHLSGEHLVCSGSKKKGGMGPTTFPSLRPPNMISNSKHVIFRQQLKAARGCGFKGNPLCGLSLPQGPSYSRALGPVLVGSRGLPWSCRPWKPKISSLQGCLQLDRSVMFVATQDPDPIQDP